jgi:SAM-dependent methyltransferase
MQNNIAAPKAERKVLNVGGGSKQIPIPQHYQGWTHHLLDIDPRDNPDIVCDARQLMSLAPNAYDGVYCSHNLEHYYRHDAEKVLRGFLHILKDDGFVEIHVPDMDELFKIVVQQQLDIDDVLYQSKKGAITVHDVIYGYGREIIDSGNDFYAHKTGFTQKSLTHFLHQMGFPYVFSTRGNLNASALAFKNRPTPFYQSLFGICVED